MELCRKFDRVLWRQTLSDCVPCRIRKPIYPKMQKKLPGPQSYVSIDEYGEYKAAYIIRNIIQQ